MKTQTTEKLKQLSEIIGGQEVNPYSAGSLYAGAPGIFLFRLYYQRFLDEPNETLEENLIELISDQIQKAINATSFCNGIVGFAWFIDHLKAEGFVDLDDDLLADFDEVAFETAKADFENQNHDFMHGALGNMFYLACRYERAESSKQYMAPLFDLLLKASSEDKNGIYWIETPIMLDDTEVGQEIINLHLSHGQASKIMVLTKMVAAGFDAAKPALQKAINYLMAQELVNQEDAVIPSRIINGEPEGYAHLGWCRGNISVAVVLHAAAEVLKDETLKKRAIEIGLHTLRHSASNSSAKITDFAFCHGIMGLSHLYNRLYQSTGQIEFKKQADLWLSRALTEAVFEDGIAGFKSWNTVAKEWVNDFSMLSGAAGIGLCLLGHLSAEKMNWDSCFLLS